MPNESIYIDYDVLRAHNPVPGTVVQDQILARFSQVYRSAEASMIFRRITGLAINSRARLTELFDMVKNQKYDLETVLQNPELETYVNRTGVHYFH